jgi:hypothetical protein
MSQSSTPTLPFVLPMYELMKNGLSAQANDPNLSPQLQLAAAAGINKLNKYYPKAWSNQFNVLATGMCFTESNTVIHNCFLVLHPSLRTEWFRKMGDNMATRAEVLFRHVAETYHANLTAESTTAEATVGGKPQQAPSQGDNSWLHDICDVDVPDVTSDSQKSAAEKLQDEIRRYLRFEGGKGEINNPLLWWKVRVIPPNVIACPVMIFIPRYMLHPFLQLLAWRAIILQYLRQVCP